MPRRSVGAASSSSSSSSHARGLRAESRQVPLELRLGVSKAKQRRHRMGVRHPVIGAWFQSTVKEYRIDSVKDVDIFLQFCQLNDEVLDAEKAVLAWLKLEVERLEEKVRARSNA